MTDSLHIFNIKRRRKGEKEKEKEDELLAAIALISRS